MEIKVPYGSEAASLRLPPDIEVDFLQPNETTPLVDIEDAFHAALSKPVGAPSLGDSLSAENSVVILISDITRAKGSDGLLPLLVGYLKDAGIAPSAITVLIARGTHRKLTKGEKDFLRSSALAGVKVEEHDCDNTEKLSALLLTQRGTPVRTNTALKDVDVTILLSPISFHYFAGFGGGRKLILPGSTDRASIMANHKLSLVDGDPVRLHAQCRSGNLDGNPIHEDMCETLRALHGVFGINFFSTVSGDLAFINAGNPIRAHTDACDAYAGFYIHQVDRPYDVMILSAGGSPYDINLLQAHKALRNAASGLKPGGSVLYFAKCEEGVGSKNLEAALRIKRDKFLKVAYKNYDLNNQTVVSLRDLTARFEIGMVSAMNVDVLLSCGIRPCVNTESFLARALEKHRTNRVAVISHGAMVLPRVVDGDES